MGWCWVRWIRRVSGATRVKPLGWYSGQVLRIGLVNLGSLLLSLVNLSVTLTLRWLGISLVNMTMTDDLTS